MHLLSNPLEAGMTVSLTSDEIIHSYSASSKLQQDEEPFAPCFFLQDNDIFLLVEIVNGLLNRSKGIGLETITREGTQRRK